MRRQLVEHFEQKSHRHARQHQPLQNNYFVIFIIVQVNFYNNIYKNSSVVCVPTVIDS